MFLPKLKTSEVHCSLPAFAHRGRAAGEPFLERLWLSPEAEAPSSCGPATSPPPGGHLPAPRPALASEATQATRSPTNIPRPL